MRIIFIATILAAFLSSNLALAQGDAIPFPSLDRVPGETTTQIGNRVEDRCAELIKSHKGDVILTRHTKGVAQGPDLIYRHPNGNLVIVEVKAHSSTAKIQDVTTEGNLRKCQNLLNYRNANPASLQAVNEAMEGLASGKTKVQFVREGTAFEMNKYLPEAPRAKVDEVVSQWRQAYKPHVLKTADDVARQLAARTGIEEKAMKNAIDEASRAVTKPGESCVVKTGGKVLKFVARVAGPAGLVIGAALYTEEAWEIEQKFDRGELTREMADTEQAKLATKTGISVGSGLTGAASGAAIGTLLCPGPGTIIGGIVGGIGGFVGAELVMATTGLTDKVGEYLRPGVEAIRDAAAYVKSAGLAVVLTTGTQLCEWIGTENVDQIMTTLQSVGGWAGQKAVQVGTAVKDAGVIAKDAAVGAAIKVGETAADGASWAWGKAKKGALGVRSLFD